MVWISFLIALSTSVWAKELPKFLTKHAIESIRFMTADGRYAYVEKRPGVLGLVSSFRSVDFLSDSSQSDFLVKGSRFKQRLIIEVIPYAHQEYNLIKTHKILVVDWGKSQTREIGQGRVPRLHLQDEWITYYEPVNKVITVQNVLTAKKYQVKLSPKATPFFFPEVEMVSSDTIVFTDVNDKGITALIQYNLVTQKSTILYRTNQNATRLELCQGPDYLAIGEFPIEDILRNSKIMQIKISGSTNLSGFTTLYNSTDADIGNILCEEKALYFVKTMKHQRNINYKQTEAVKLDLKTSQIQTLTDLQAVTQLVSMDGRVLVPFRGEFFVLEGLSNFSEDKLKNVPTNNNEELPLDI